MLETFDITRSLSKASNPNNEERVKSAYHSVKPEIIKQEAIHSYKE